MATTTPNFGWPVPTSSDLVKNGATAIEGLGDAIDASLLDLKGGTTGQVLSKATNTDMDFTWVAQDDSNAIQNAIVDAKGDLIAATANDTPARLAVGTNGQVLTADSTAATGLKWAAASGGSTYVGVGAYKTSNQDINNATFTAITFQAESFDTDGFHDNSTNTSRFTVPSGKAGKYSITGTVSFSANNTGSRHVAIYKNAALLNYNSALQTNSTSPYGTLIPISIVVNLAVSDYIEIYAFQSSGGTLPVAFGGSGSEAVATNVQMSYLGA